MSQKKHDWKLKEQDKLIIAILQSCWLTVGLMPLVKQLVMLMNPTFPAVWCQLTFVTALLVSTSDSLTCYQMQKKTLQKKGNKFSATQTWKSEWLPSISSWSFTGDVELVFNITFCCLVQKRSYITVVKTRWKLWKQWNKSSYFI